MHEKTSARGTRYQSLPAFLGVRKLCSPSDVIWFFMLVFRGRKNLIVLTFTVLDLVKLVLIEIKMQHTVVQLTKI